jgi:oxalate decarboxylase/phosphoglucose isomerase-like protein (cupin superfamily)
MALVRVCELFGCAENLKEYGFGLRRWGRAKFIAEQAGDVFFIPAGVAHDGRNVGQTKAALVSVFFADDGKPLASPVSSTGNNPQGRR